MKIKHLLASAALAALSAAPAIAQDVELVKLDDQQMTEVKGSGSTAGYYNYLAYSYASAAATYYYYGYYYNDNANQQYYNGWGTYYSGLGLAYSGLSSVYNAMGY